MYLAIDYGKKFIGLAVSDESGTLAFPLNILPNDENLPIYIKKICEERNVKEIVIGNSVNQQGLPNPIAKDAEELGEILVKDLHISVKFEKEQFTSAHARDGVMNGRVDASAAALILQRFLDKNNKV